MKAKFISEILNERFHDEEFEKKFAAYQRNKSKITIIEKDGDWELVKNPPSLKYFGNGGEVSGITIDGGRGIALKNGDIYIESWSKLTHHSILEILAKHRITKFPDKNWWEDFYSEDIYDDETGIIPLRYLNNKIGISSAIEPDEDLLNIFNKLQQNHNIEFEIYEI